VHGERAAIGHGIDGVEDEIGQRIANLALLSEDGRERLLQFGAHGDRDSALLREVTPADARQLDHLRDDRIQVDLRQRRLAILRPVELTHALHGLADVGDRAPDDVQIAARAIRQAAFVFQQRIRVQRDGRDRVVDVVRDTARHLAERAQAFLLHHCLLALPQVVVRLLQSRVELRLMCGERDVIAQLSQELAFVAGERSRFLASDDQHTEHGALRKQRRDHQRAQPCVHETSREVAADFGNIRLVDQLTFHARRESVAVDGDAFVLRHRRLLGDCIAA
jgi:hypothetical protein